ncbi:TIGR00730 family Rossman fold protein [Betaproteobacteria bacterium]|nr:TIGR00730 family Rossman fold protein [Betaproteobacteria bacterium]
MNTEVTKRVCIFCGHRTGRKKVWVDFARNLGNFLGKNKYILFYGGGGKGIMGSVALAAKKSGARVYGVITEKLAEKEPILENIDEVTVVKSLSERKEKMIETCHAAIVLPGGIGTLDELFDLWAKTQLGVEEKILILVDINGYYSKLLEFLRHVVDEEFLSEDQLLKTKICQNLDEVIIELNKLDVDNAKFIY